ncbi:MULTISPECIES: peptidoglycan DD-metalloendopeptidase family protein [Pseudomonas syringae group]|jgi:murein DD-endopeptidase MepM/ murein hydrolase activator NlpD|uniref:M24/M37 family peptidase n=3 Tax=Pseudomonas syringae group TaxID=136849 RepID=A0A3M4Y1B6_9PSED|nr:MULTISPECIES: peptidoglycan DD-metalloendopeptidase family protein [Pseudomonas syringae group]KPY97879.1 M24/M37 family peptidase [Pseudomonas syringae pv. aptata]MBS7469744.1 peptidoglycan DD-metalloendopeptidase family protein [Pseudomonas syringae]MCF5737235.1 peptidoglycan DD-metalloendopeptidase family protein [Pseudomonas syringae]MCF5738503.1 peptidoglycan DD-metalloendopeptidase family protein [Pseudomonas syringae]MCF5750166.1 peptidoglycan DD-metalloendopeptidase family protein [
MLRFIAPLFALLLCLPAHADSFITRALDKPVPGGVAVIDLGTGAQAPTAIYQGKPVLVVKEQGTRWLAIVGIPLTVKPGTQQVTSGGRTLNFTVGSKKYPEQHITLKNKRQVNPNPEDNKRIEGELAEQLRAYRSFSPGTPSNLILDKPVNGPLSSKFGVRRFFNGEERNPHSGLDFAVPAGTPIKSPAAGKVILTGNYFFNGNTVFVDHGQGFISMFCHMSKIDVKVGDLVPRGGVVGKVGATGRATGPHMHWNVSLNDARVDPAIFIGAFQP